MTRAIHSFSAKATRRDGAFGGDRRHPSFGKVRVGKVRAGKATP